MAGSNALLAGCLLVPLATGGIFFIYAPWHFMPHFLANLPCLPAYIYELLSFLLAFLLIALFSNSFIPICGVHFVCTLLRFQAVQLESPLAALSHQPCTLSHPLG